jgi:hypothetical protein
MRAARSFEIILLLLAVGCAAVKPPVPVAPSEAAAEAPAGLPSAATQVTPAPTFPVQVGGAPPQPAAPSATQVPAPPQPRVLPSPPPATNGIAKAPPPSVQVPKKETTASDVAKQKEPTLDLASLERRLKDTKAIGVLTKISLKNQVDDLLSQFRGFYAGKLKTTLAELRQSYDLLVLKVLSLLQDSDAALAAAIVASREAIWGILADPAKFAKI